MSQSLLGHLFNCGWNLY